MAFADETFDLLSSLRETPAPARRERLERLPLSTLVELVLVLLGENERERSQLESELAARDFHIRRLEALLAGRRHD